MIPHRTPRLAPLLLALGFLPNAASGEDAPAPATPKAAEPNYAAELKPIPHRDPAQSQQAFAVRPGFRVALAAAEPLLRSPVALDFDEDGRLYVAEFPEYNDYAASTPHGKGCIRLLEDLDGDGVYDKSVVFADDLPRAVAVGCWDGGVYVGSAPDLLYLKDTNGDGKADVRKVVFTGFGKDHAGEGMLNSFRWGFDNRFHISTNLDGGDVRRADLPDARTVSVRGHGFVFDPRDLSFALTGGGGQHGMSLDDWGRAYVCGNSDPFHLVMYDSRYLARNPYVQAPPAAVNIAPAGKYTKIHRVSAVEPWRQLRTRLRSQKVVPGSDEGGASSGFFTGGTGVTVYRGDAYPPEFRGNLFVGDVANNIVHRAFATPDGLLVQARSAEEGREFLASHDNFFRPVQMANGPDGCLWVVDMNRELIEGAAFLPPQILKHMDVAAGVNHGRIWRVLPEGRNPKLPRLSKATTADLVALLEHPDGWRRDTASRLLYQRQDKSSLEPLRTLAATSKSPLGRTYALHSLAGQNALDPALVLTALGDADPHVRQNALRLAEPLCANDPKLQGRVLALVADPDPLVRYQLAFSLGALPDAQPAPALAALANTSGQDPWMSMAILSSTANCSGELFRQLADQPGFRATAPGKAFLAALAAQTGGAGRGEDLAAVLNALDGPLAKDESLSRALVSALLSKMSAAGKARLSAANGGRAAGILAAQVAEAKKTAANERLSPTARASAIRALRFAPFADVQPLLAASLTSRQPLVVQAAAVETLAQFDEPEVATVLLEEWPSMSPKLRATATETLFARPAWIRAFLDAFEKKTVSRGDVDPARLDLLKTYPNAEVRERASKLFSGTSTSRQAVVTAYQKALSTPGDRDRGKTTFKSNCSACHRLEGVGQQVGADLSAVRDRGLDSVLLNILDPNREVKPQFLTYTLVTESGRILTGMITAETANSLTIRNPDGGEETVLRLQVDELRSTGLSYMPEGLEKQIDVPAMADLLAYLNSLK